MPGTKLANSGGDALKAVGRCRHSVRRSIVSALRHVPQNHIVIDFDLRDDDGNKSLTRNLKLSHLPSGHTEKQ